jgi:integration host factor subunit alpha
MLGGMVMVGKNVTRVDLAEAVYQRVGLSRVESAELVERIIQEICDTLATGETLKLSGFGNFTVRDKNERMARNPKTGAAAPVTAHRAITFSASHVLKAHVNGSKQTPRPG